MGENSWTYKQAGVDINSGYDAVKEIKKHAEKTFVKGVLGGLGSFGGAFELPTGFQEPVLVSGTDGVGTKLEVAFKMNKHNTIGIDCVAMCVNDIACQGAKPLFFLDYIGTGILESNIVSEIVKGISDGCIDSGCALIGGETAEMPGFYKADEYDLAGFAVGICEKSKLITGKDITQGDVLIGVSSSGLHSNGYSLVRKLLFDVAKFEADTYLEDIESTIGEEILKPTKIYVSLIQKLINKFNIKGIAHITGGGWYENIPRIFQSENLLAKVNKIPAPKIFQLLQKIGNVSDKEMYNTFNMGIGLVLAVSKNDAEDILSFINSCVEKSFILGEVLNKNDFEERVLIV